MLALPLMEANRPVSKDRLIDAMWGEHPPVSASETLDTYISRLRRILGPDRLARRPAGYELRADAGELDLTTFDELVSEAEQLLPEDPNAAAAIFRKALALWNGDPIGDLRYELSMTGITDQLAERHLAALERQAEADLAGAATPSNWSSSNWSAWRATIPHASAWWPTSCWPSTALADSRTPCPLCSRADIIYPGSSGSSRASGSAGWSSASLSTTRGSSLLELPRALESRQRQALLLDAIPAGRSGDGRSLPPC